ncbi:MAG: hypothetical protein FWC47_17455 [Oscillospiraceae bacterium]|nr:hypothetical protein [Oscillospiraceae bacterium]
MPQLSLYIDDDALQKLEMGAKIKETSISKFVASLIKDYFSNSWPVGFTNLIGSITDETFTIPDDIDSNLDAEREEL